MKRILFALSLVVLLLAACTTGSSTTLRPAADRPIVGPDGTLWDAIEAARGGHSQRMERLLSTGFVHRAILPNVPRVEPTDEEEYALALARMERELASFGPIRARLYTRYTQWLNDATRGYVIETDRPEYDLKYKDGYGAARGPNSAKLKVWLHAAASKEPKLIVVSFIQDGDAWRIDGFTPDPLYGEFIR